MADFEDKWEKANRENVEGLPYIDDGQRKLFYRFTPSKSDPVGAPLFVILHGHGTRAATRFKKEGWNVLVPVDHFGYEGKGCWWLGEDGDFFVKDLLQRLIKKISTQYQCENNIYFYGSSMGGYGAILHGMLCNARAVYANVPQIKLLESSYSERSMKRFFSFIFSEDVSVENDLVNFLETVEKKTDFPVFYLCENGISGKNEHQNYLSEHAEYFVNKCKKKNIKYHLEILPKSGHDKNYGIKEVLDKLERFTPPEDKNKCESIAGVFYPRKKLMYKNESALKYHFTIDNGKSFELEVEGISRYKFLYADEKQLITKKNSNTFQISYDDGKSWGKEKQLEGLNIIQVYPLFNGNYLVGGIDCDNRSLVFLLNEECEIMAEHQLGQYPWHSQNAIDENESVLMFAEYQNFSSTARLPQEVCIFRSKDDGLTWEKVFSLKHPEEVRHWYTLQKDPYRPNHWLATGGDTPEQSRWFLSKDNGDTWQEITDLEHYNESVPNRSLSAHRTTAIDITKNYYYYSTDDLMGGVPGYFSDYKGVRQTSAKLYRASKTEPIKIELLSNIGIHGRSMIDIGEGYIIITEGKYATFNSQVFYVDKDDFQKVYLLFDIYSDKRQSGSASMNSKLIKNKYFYIPLTRGMLMHNESQTLKWNISYTDENKFIEYNVKDYIKFEEHLWFLNNVKSIDNITFRGNRVQLDLKEKENVFYLLLGDHRTNTFSSKKLFELGDEQKNIEIAFNAKKESITDISCYIQMYDDERRVFSISNQVENGLNKIQITKKEKAKYIRVLFRISGTKKDTIVFSDLGIDFLDSKTLTDTLSKHIQGLSSLEKKSYLLTVAHSYYSDSFTFRPRKDNLEYKINLPLDWDINPYNENNWMFHLHALRLLDREMSDYMLSRDNKLLKRMITVILDWKRDIVDQKKNLDFNREEYKESFAWHDMATGLRAVKIAFVLETILKMEDDNSFDEYINDMYKLVNLHIEALRKQTLASNNHAIYQLHGLLMLLRLFPDNNKEMYDLKQQAEMNMQKVFNAQFFNEGIHKENSSRYHFLAIETFGKILEKDVYSDIFEVFKILDKAKENSAYMHFPNYEGLMTGDSDYVILKPQKEEVLKEGITYFKESGYTYIYEENDDPSMLFFDTAFLNRTHRHADFFNVLLYEYGKNILVDAGKYSYVKDNPFRQYCVSTRAHNTVLIDNEDYRLDRKYFFTSKLMLQEKRKEYYYLLASNDYDYFEVSHDRHIFYKPKEFLLVVDVLLSKDPKDFKQIFHLHQDLELQKEGGSLTSNITNDLVMYIQMKSLDMHENTVQSNLTHAKGLEGDIEGYRALGHNEVVENYVLVNQTEGNDVVLGSMFSFEKELDFTLSSTKENKIEIKFDRYKHTIGG